MEVYLSVRQASYYVDGVLFATVHNQGTQNVLAYSGLHRNDTVGLGLEIPKR